MTLVVPDAPVILKWVLPPVDEPFSQRAITLLDDFLQAKIDLLTPALWFFEVGNTLARKYPETAAEVLADLRRLGIPEARMNDIWQTQITTLTNQYHGTFYDASYHALAVVHNGLFVTADSRYVSLAKSAGHVRALSDW